MICPYCKKDINPKLIKNHMERCPKKPVKKSKKSKKTEVEEAK